MPEGRPIFSTRCMMMNTAFATTASVMRDLQSDENRARLVTEHGAENGAEFHD